MHTITGSKLTHVELAEQDGTGGTQPGHHRGIFIGDKVAKNRRAASREQAFGPELVLDRVRHAMKRPTVLATCQLLLRGSGGLQRFLTADGDIAV